jgi:hypothetical protein
MFVFCELRPLLIARWVRDQPGWAGSQGRSEAGARERYVNVRSGMQRPKMLHIRGDLAMMSAFRVEASWDETLPWTSRVWIGGRRFRRLRFGVA